MPTSELLCRTRGAAPGRRGPGPTDRGREAVDEQLPLLATVPAQPVIDRLAGDRGGQRAAYFGGAAAMPASCSTLQYVSADWRADTSRDASASAATASSS
jgi:hypothetical protein